MKHQKLAICMFLIFLGLNRFLSADFNHEVLLTANNLQLGILNQVTDYTIYPSSLGLMSESYFLLDVYGYRRFTQSNQITSPDPSIGSLNQRSGQQEYKINPLWISQIGFGAQFILGLESSIYHSVFRDRTDQDYSSPGIASTEYQSDHNYSLRPSLAISYNLPAMSIGVHYQFGFFMDPSTEEFLKLTNSSINDGTSYYSSPTLDSYSVPYTTAVSDLKHFLTISAQGELGGVSLTWENQRIDFDREYAIDTTEDGYPDTLVSETDYYLSSISQGGRGSVYFDEMDEIGAQRITLGMYIKPFQQRTIPLTLLFSFDLLDTLRRESFMHLSSDDQSYTSTAFTQTLSDFRGYAMYSYQVNKDIDLNLSVGFEYQKTRMQQEGLLSNGESEFVEQNTNHFDQFIATNEPTNNQIRFLGTPEPDRELIFSIPTGFEIIWRATPRLTMFSNFTMALIYQQKLYAGYELLTNQIWEETITDMSFSLSTPVAGGILIALTEALALTIKSSLDPVSAAVENTTSAVPYSKSGPSSELGYDLDMSEQQFKIDISLIIKL
jgi:hypothetical protein